MIERAGNDVIYEMGTDRKLPNAIGDCRWNRRLSVAVRPCQPMMQYGGGGIPIKAPRS